jgi:hypothetical protein
MRKSGKLWMGSGCLQSWRCNPQTYPRPAALHGWSGGGMATGFFLWEEERANADIEAKCSERRVRAYSVEKLRFSTKFENI